MDDIKLTIPELEQALEANSKALEQALKTGSLGDIRDLNTQRAVLKDCLIEALTNNLNLLKQAI